MKVFKKLMSYFIALTMVLSLATLLGGNVHAAGGTTDTGNSLTITNTGKTAHTFELYQIFTGTKNTDDALGDIQWGSGVSEEGQNTLGNAANKATNLTNEAAAKAFAKALADGRYLTNPTRSGSVAAGGEHKFDNLKTGYYLVKDVDGSQTGNKSAYTEYICKVVGSTTAKTKLDVPTVVKKVKDTNDSTGATPDWQDSADADINDYVQYQITGTMPDNIDAYTTYKYEFTDTMSQGLTYVNDKDDKDHKTTITIDGKDVTGSFTESVTPGNNGTTVTWSRGNLKDISGVTLDKNTKVVVTYFAKLNESAVIGPTGNPNTVDLTYSNNPNKGGDGETGKTPEDKNIVFTYKAVVNKVDQGNQPLAGAEFDLLKKAPNDEHGNEVWTNVATGIKAEKVTDASGNTSYTAEYKGLDDGIYKIHESKTPDGYNTADDIVFTITADHEETSDNPTLKSLTVNNDKLAAHKDTGTVTTNVVNQKGSELPETGGMGTTLLYVAGGILVACAAAYVVLNKKRA